MHRSALRIVPTSHSTLGRSIRSTRIPAWLLRTWQRYATMAHSPSQLCCPKIHTRGQVGSTTAICANATRSCTTLLAHAMRARERRGSFTLSGRLTAPPQQLPESFPTRSQMALRFPSGPSLTHLLVTAGTLQQRKP